MPDLILYMVSNDEVAVMYKNGQYVGRTIENIRIKPFEVINWINKTGKVKECVEWILKKRREETTDALNSFKILTKEVQ